jgi:hypothetical protein
VVYQGFFAQPHKRLKVRDSKDSHQYNTLLVIGRILLVWYLVAGHCANTRSVAACSSISKEVCNAMCSLSGSKPQPATGFCGQANPAPHQHAT